MRLVREMHMSDFSNYFLAYIPEDSVPKSNASVIIFFYTRVATFFFLA
jgi:hypothetical protein